MHAENNDTQPPPAFSPLASRSRFLPWQERDGRKVPVSAHTGRNASVTNPQHFGTWEEAQRRADQIVPRHDQPAQGGVGVVLGLLPNGKGALCGIDLDTCRNPRNGTLEPWATEIMGALSTYAEVSPSGTGVKVFFVVTKETFDRLAEITGGRNAWKASGAAHPPGVELYWQARYFTVTGQQIGTAAAAIEIATEAQVRRIVEIAQRAFPERMAAAADAQPRATAPKQRDESRSGAAFRLALKIMSAGGTIEDFEAALRADPELASWAEEGADA